MPYRDEDMKGKSVTFILNHIMLILENFEVITFSYSKNIATQLYIFYFYSSISFFPSILIGVKLDFIDYLVEKMTGSPFFPIFKSEIKFLLNSLVKDEFMGDFSLLKISGMNSICMFDYQLSLTNTSLNYMNDFIKFCKAKNDFSPFLSLVTIREKMKKKIISNFAPTKKILTKKISEIEEKRKIPLYATCCFFKDDETNEEQEKILDYLKKLHHIMDSCAEYFVEKILKNPEGQNFFLKTIKLLQHQPDNYYVIIQELAQIRKNFKFLPKIIQEDIKNELEKKSGLPKKILNLIFSYGDLRMFLPVKEAEYSLPLAGITPYTRQAMR